MVRTATDVYYYAVREMGEDDAYQGTSLPKDASSHPVTFICWSYYHYDSGWIHRRIQRMSRQLSHIEKWQYDILDAVGVPTIGIPEAINWNTPWRKQ